MKHPVRKAYQSQKDCAKQRKIEFKFTYEEWIVWWDKHLGSDWFNLRGCKRGQYVMARLQDKGSYEDSNIECILHTTNTKDAKNNIGVNNPRAKITAKTALLIRNSPKTGKVLAKEFGLSVSTIAQIKRGDLWGHL